MDFVGVDMGASGTRYVSSKGHINVAPNNMVLIPDGQVVTMEPYNSELESGLELVVRRWVNGAVAGQWHVLYGQMAYRYSGTNDTPNLLKNKFEQEINMLSAVMAAALGSYRDGLDSQNLTLYLALPPVEVKSHMEEVVASFIGDYQVCFVKLGITMNLSFKRVVAYEESFMALLDFFFENNGTPRAKVSKYASGNLLSLDIGASTTDLAVVQNMKYLEHTGKTIKAGGNVARQHMQEYVLSTWGFDAPNDLLEQAIAEGRIQLGNGYQDCALAVQEAKKKLAKEIVNHITSYFRAINIPIQTLRAIVVSGGGSMQGSYIDDNNNEVITSPSVSKYITEYLQDVCDTVAVEQMENSPRLANVNGLFIRASMDMRKYVKEQAAAAQAAAISQGQAPGLFVGQTVPASQVLNTVPYAAVTQQPAEYPVVGEYPTQEAFDQAVKSSEVQAGPMDLSQPGIPE